VRERAFDGWGWLMRLAVRWGAAVAASAAGFVLAWWVCQELFRLDEGASLGIAGGMLAVVIAVAGWWAARGTDGQGPGGSGRRLVQQARAGRDANLAGRDQRVISYRDRNE
jgi:hypothetical protein